MSSVCNICYQEYKGLSTQHIKRSKRHAEAVAYRQSKKTAVEQPENTHTDATTSAINPMAGQTGEINNNTDQNVQDQEHQSNSNNDEQECSSNGHSREMLMANELLNHPISPITERQYKQVQKVLKVFEMLELPSIKAVREFKANRDKEA